MNLKGLSIFTVSLIALLGTPVAMAGGKHGEKGKAATECAEKGGTWHKKKKTCDMPKTNEEPKTETPAPEDMTAPPKD